MRLVCPNCDAQYEVDDGAIADAGRDVQCSNCGHTWFQLPPDLEAEMDAEDALFGTPAAQVAQPLSSQSVVSPRSKAEDQASGQAGAKTGAQDSVWDDDAADEDDGAKKAADPSPNTENLAAALAGKVASATPTPPARAPAMPAPPPMPSPPPLPNPPPLASAGRSDPDKPTQPAEPAPQPPVARRGLDESLMAVLREEAERETSVRRAETPRALESQPDLGLEETTGAASAAKAVRDRLARLRGPEPEPETADKPTARRDLLPDIEEINSTLRASTENRSGDEVAMADAEAVGSAKSSGFRSGFSMMLLIAVVLIATYLAAPKIAAQFPASKGALESYVLLVDAARVWLDAAMRSAISGLQSLTGGTES